MGSVLPCTSNAFRLAVREASCGSVYSRQIVFKAGAHFRTSSPAIGITLGLRPLNRSWRTETRSSTSSWRLFSSTAISRKEEWPKVSVTDPASVQPQVSEPSIAQADQGTARDVASATTRDTAPSSEAPSPSPLKEPMVTHVPDEDLPSRRAALRSRLTKWFNAKMEELIPKMLLVSQRINSFTGTDYSAIEELRREIKQQEQLVSARHTAVTKAKEALEHAHVQRGASQKEVVQLLERKHSWSAADLERYMTLIRSEHQNDHAVQEAKDIVGAAEKALEESRARLETRERRQYHEEQIWSDTIRRNSTWITFGLMGVNFLLLLMNLVVFEPYRRRKIVREMKAALDERTIAAGPAAVIDGHKDLMVAPGKADAPLQPTLDVEIPAVDNTSSPSSAVTISIEAPSHQSPKPDVTNTDAHPGTDAATVGITRPTETVRNVLDAPESNESDRTESTDQGQEPHSSRSFWTIEGLRFYASDLVSDRPMTVRMLDITTIAVESAMAGAALVALLVVMSRP